MHDDSLPSDTGFEPAAIRIRQRTKTNHTPSWLNDFVFTVLQSKVSPLLATAQSEKDTFVDIMYLMLPFLPYIHLIHIIILNHHFSESYMSF